jgi:hypothetical protein
MRRLLTPICLATLTSLFIAPQAKACINDRDTFRTEQEYKKNYEFKSGFTPEPKPSYESPAPGGDSLLTTSATGSGVVMLLFAGGLSLVNFSRIGRK